MSSQQSYRWISNALPSSSEFEQLRDSLKFDEILTSILWSRGVRDFEAARRFFRPSTDFLHDPFRMADMEKAAARVIRAIDSGERIMVYGDYDVDGTTAVALVSSYLDDFTDHVVTYIPDRYKEGYGLSEEGIRTASDNDISVIIALDCGIKAHEQAKLARELSIDLIIGDHHTPGASLPEAYAVLDPKRKDCTYPYKELSGCGVGYKLCVAIEKLRGRDGSALHAHLDLLAISIAADIVPITGENRVLAHLGMDVLNMQDRPAIRLMIQAAQKSKFTITDVVFTIAPRINAAGRIKHASAAVELLKSKDGLEAQRVLGEINQHNTERKQLDSAITDLALEQIESLSEYEHSTVVYHESWHKGVIGIVASRLIETHYRPTVVFTKSNGVLAGSARSVIGFNLYDALDACSEQLIQFGGHMYAAGMTMEEERLSEFRTAFDQYVANNLKEEQKTPEIHIDAELNLEEVNNQFLRRLKMFEPHGPGNPLPIFSMKLNGVSGVRVIGSNKDHLKFTVAGMDCIAFKMASWEKELHDGDLEIAFHIEENEFRGRVKPQLRVLDIRRV
ncbi:single-stranded-DNA-specific exonuclease RecJ [Phaeocystidibacter luteus]|uniref:Single-stranded-DNA-specific exonuclease RecJ n=1 Tax=Phaeocystidibacter luteus TaxID=911197 RepID=A0A6N6RIC5_9FLAO|nr:single-stranded-DNA-specific exonuclease RecJ [Phaeocystidibacter luteus]KAB2814024.1 single-stranded-DNA-specific exonuclease RecJ [Phaeocystidibacter luteus]